MSKCCHPLLIWMLNFLLIITSIILSVTLLMTTLTARPKIMVPTQRKILELTVAEECMVAHAAFCVIWALFLHHSMKLIASGGHRDDDYRIEKDFKIVAGMSVASALIVTILSIVVYVFREDALKFSGSETEATTTPKVTKFSDWYYATTTAKETVHGTTPMPYDSKVNLYVLFLLIIDILSLVLTLCGVATIVGCNKRELYDVELAVEKARLRRTGSRVGSRSRLSSHSSSQHHLRS